MTAQLGVIAAVSAVVIVGILLATFLIGELIGRHNVVDVAWGLAFTGVALVSALIGDGDEMRRWLLAGLTGIWGLRLAGYLAIRSRGHGEDPRYEALLSKSRHSRIIAVLCRVYLLQGGLIWLVSLPIQLSASLPGRLPWWTWVGIAIWCVGLGFEAVGDAQLRNFKLQPRNRGTVMGTGLWRYTRHPNYFGDACVWWGLYLICLTAGPLVLLTIVSPVAMTVLLVRVSGKSLLERHMAERPGYADYVRRTSGFIPLPPRADVGGQRC